MIAFILWLTKLIDVYINWNTKFRAQLIWRADNQAINFQVKKSGVYPLAKYGKK